jgi:Tol biopolymer transport system component
MNRYKKRNKRTRRRLIAPIAVVLIILGGVGGVLIGNWLSQYPPSNISQRRSAATTAESTTTATLQQTSTQTATLTNVGAPAVSASRAVTTTDGAPPTRALIATADSRPTAVVDAAAPTTAPAALTTVPVEEAAPAAATAQPVEEAAAVPTAEESNVTTTAQATLSTAPAETVARYAAAFDPAGQLTVPLLFVSRRITERGTVYWDQAKGMPGVGPFSRFEVAAPGRLMLLAPDGTPRILVDGANPTAASLNLIDVSAPDLSYDGQTILFAGLPAGEYQPGYMTDPGAWRIYTIGVDGTDLRQLTFSDRDLDLTQFGAMAKVFEAYDDTDPVWLPDGRIVFASTRWPAFGQYGGARTTNLFVMDADGRQMHRITSERNGAERPLIDPLTGQIVYTRWWRNFRVPTNDLQLVTATNQAGFHQKDGLLALTDSTEEDPIPGGTPNVGRNAWHLGVINPDGGGLKLFTGGSGVFLLGEDANHAYGGAFAPDGTLYANYYPMKNMTEASGFGGIRRYERGPYTYQSIVGVTGEGQYPVVSENPAAFGVNQSAYASDPAVLPDGRLVFSWAPDYQQDYGLYAANADGTNRQKLLDVPGLTELRAQVVAPRSVPPVIPDVVTAVANMLPPAGEAPRESDGAFVFNALNVYFNAPVDTEIISGVPVGQAGSIRFFMDHQRTQPGSLDWVDWPVLLQELPIEPDGSVVAQLPANVPLFEQLRSPQPAYEVPLTGRASPDSPGVAQVLGHNFGRPGEVSNCVGCHAGHSLIAVPDDPAEAAWSNLAPGATVSASSVHPLIGGNLEGLVDRRVQKGRLVAYWRSDPAQSPTSQWVQLTFAVPVTVRTVRLYNPRQDSDGISTVQVTGATVRLYSDANATQEIGQATTGALSVAGSDLPFAEVTARTVRVEITGVTGTFENELVASLAEVEIIARAEAATGGALAQAGP